MKIVDVSTTSVYYPHIAPIQNAVTPEPVPFRRGRLFVHLKTDGELEGLGVGEDAPGTRQIVEAALKPLLIDRDPIDVEGLWNQMQMRIRAYGDGGIASQALSAVDVALWDLKAKALGLPLYRLLGAVTDSVPVYGSGGWTNLTAEELTTEMTGHVERGMKRVKMKVGKDSGRSEREDVERVATVRSAVGEDVALCVDANSGYHPKQAIYMAREFEHFQVGWLEEPTTPEDLRGLAEVRNATTIPIAVGEREDSIQGFKDMMAASAVDIVQPYVSRIGGVTGWTKAAHLAEAFNLPLAPHGMQLVSLHLACATPNLKSVEYLNAEAEGDRVWFTEIPEPINGSWTPFADRPGLGLELDPHTVEKWSV